MRPSREALTRLGLTWYDDGQSALSGPLLALERRLEGVFLRLADGFRAVEHRFPALIPLDVLERVGYLRSFPQLATFPTVLDADPDNLDRFRRALEPGGGVRLTATAPIRDLLTPAACYHVYPRFAGRDLDGRAVVTTRNTCFRREAGYAPLERQWSFAMREIVSLGAAGEVRAFLDQARSRVEAFTRELDLPITWQAATDPFFRPLENPKYVMQRLEPVKTEMVFEGLALGSINFHHDSFGEAFDIRRGGENAFSGCVAFGLERWVLAIVERFGADPRRWPPPFSLEEP